MGYLAISHKTAVEIDKQAGIHPVKVQIYLLGELLGGEGKGFPIYASRVIVRHKGRIERDGIFDVGILVVVISQYLPAAGNGDGIKSVGRSVLGDDILRDIVPALKIPKLPIVSV